MKFNFSELESIAKAVQDADAHMSNLFQENERLTSTVSTLREERDRARLLLADAYESMGRDGWEDGLSDKEIQERICDHLANAGLDPNTNGGPEAIAKLRAFYTQSETKQAEQTATQPASTNQEGVSPGAKQL